MALTLALATPVWAQSSGLDSVESYIRAELARHKIPGLSVAILRGDSVLLSRGYGYANLELRVPASDSTIYQSGSVGKQFTAAAIVMLAEEHKLGLDDPITRYFAKAPAPWRGITIRHLLTHTSGIPDYADSTFDLRRDFTENQLVDLAAKMPLGFKAGDRWSYSNTGYVLLGILIHRVTGVFYGDFLHDRIFAPAGMTTTRIISESDIVLNRSAGYRLDHGTLKNQEWVSPSLNTTADGSLYLTVKDLAHWAIALNHRRFPSPDGLEASWTPVKLNNGGTYPYGFGWAIEQQRGFRRIGHGGAWQGFRTRIERYPDFDLTVIVLANLADAGPQAIAHGIAGILEPKLQAPQLLAQALPVRSPRPTPDILRAIATGRDSTRLSSGLARFLSRENREDAGRLLQRTRSWTELGCDDVTEQKLSLLGASVERICYARGTGVEGSLVVSVFFTADDRVGFVDTERY